MLEIKKLSVSIEGKQILKEFTLTVGPGEVHALMGPNGAGKSTLARVLAGDPAYEITEGQILFQGTSLLELSPEERSHAGLFMSFQYPLEIPGVSNFQFLHAMDTARRKAKGLAPLSEELFTEHLEEVMRLVEVKPTFKERDLNTGFSGGEKKRNEILQMVLLEPLIAVLDETDSGLDIDAMRVIAGGVKCWATPERGLLLITHYQRLLDHIKPDHVHIVIDGRIVHSGGADLALALEKTGYDTWTRQLQ